jgi:hypothetical protein
MNKRVARVIAMTAGVLGVAGTSVFVGGTAFAQPQGNQQWFSDYNGWSPLGPLSPTGTYFHIHPATAPDKCLDVPGWAFYTHVFDNTEHDPSGTTVQLWDCESADWYHDYAKNQQWGQVDNGDGSWSFVVDNFAGEYALDSLGGHNYDGSPVQVFDFNDGFPQRWTIGPDYQLQSVGAPGKCLDDTGYGDYNGVQMQLWDCAY